MKEIMNPIENESGGGNKDPHEKQGYLWLQFKSVYKGKVKVTMRSAYTKIKKRNQWNKYELKTTQYSMTCSRPTSHVITLSKSNVSETYWVSIIRFVVVRKNGWPSLNTSTQVLKGWAAPETF